MDFEGKTIVVTGSTRGIGYGYAQYLADLGANVVLNGTTKDGVNKAISSLQKSSGQIEGIACPVEQGEDIVKFALDTFGNVDALINNAGFVQDAKFKNMSFEKWDAVYKNHLEASFKICKAIWPHFLEKEKGKILLTSSSAGIFGNFGQANYSAAKGGIIALGKTLAIEGKKFNIQVNTICPGAFTDMNAHLMSESVKEGMATEKVSPVAAWLCHEDCLDSGEVIEAAGGVIAKVRTEYSTQFLQDDFNIETVKGIWADLSAFENNVSHPESLRDTMKVIADHIRKSS